MYFLSDYLVTRSTQWINCLTVYGTVKQAIVIVEKEWQNPVHSGLTATLCMETETEVSN